MGGGRYSGISPHLLSQTSGDRASSCTLLISDHLIIKNDTSYGLLLGIPFMISREVNQPSLETWLPLQGESVKWQDVISARIMNPILP